MRPNFQEMSVPDLREYVLNHRQDDEAIRALFTHPSLKWKSFPPMFAKDGTPIEENIRIAEEAIRQRVEANREKKIEERLEREKEIEAKLRAKLEKEIEAKLRVKLEKEIEAKLRSEMEQEGGGS